MSVFFAAASFLNEKEAKKSENLERRRLRDHSNPLDLADSTFIANYRLKKEVFLYVLQEIRPYMNVTSVPLALQLATTLRFLAEGGYQRAVGQDSKNSLERSSVSKILKRVLYIMETVLCAKWIRLRMTPEEKRNCKIHFSTKFGIPGVVGCVDGTHIKLTKPSESSHLYFNRKGCFSVNAMVICDDRMIIRAIDACHPGSSHDAFIFNMSKSKQYFVENFEAGERNSWLLGDSGYGIEPFLITPFRDPCAASPQHRFNIQHTKARNVVERTIGVLKSRFRCLNTVLPYSPQRVVKITNICCALHNICKSYNMDDFALEYSNSDISSHNNDLQEAEVLDESRRYHDIGLNNRNDIMNSIINMDV